MTVDLSAGFAAPVADAQRCFRAVLDAMARPGTIAAVPAPDAPAPLMAAAAAVLLALADHETPLALDPALDAARHWIAFHTGAPLTHDAGQAAFVCAATLADLSSLRVGSHEMPETSATVVLQVAALGSGRRYRLSGPGLRVPAILAVDGLPAGFAASWAANHALFPRGIDLILCAGTDLAALPRTVCIEEA